MVQDDPKYENEKWCLWRFGIIAPLLHRDPGAITQNALLIKLAKQVWLYPDGTSTTLSPETLRKWLYRFQHGGLPALANQTRSDKGRFQVPEKLVDGLHEERQKHPRWSTQLVLEKMLERKLWNGETPSRSALYRFVKAHNLGRDPHLKPQPVRAFAYDAFGELWGADFMHGPKIRVGRHKRKTYLHIIMDDSCRYVVQGAFLFSEGVESLIGELETAICRFGLPHRFYVDNGSAYSSHYLRIVCARLGIQLIHTPPYRPQGRGKEERFFRTVRDRFLALGDYASLADLNAAFQEWLSQYHQRMHRTLGCSPLQRRLQSRKVIRKLPEVAKTDALFRMEKRCRVYNDGTIHLKKRRFEVPLCPPNSRVTVYFLPWDLSRVYYGDDLELARPLDVHANAKRFDHPK
ncbi:MAG: transposase [Gammaproteobacteria bacterium]|nr:transposase [Gammaproteobacteria bacterium]